MKKTFFLLTAVVSAMAISGCQSVSRVEYFEPTEANAAYSTPRSDTNQGHGPVKAIEGKSGVPDFSDNKTFRLNLNILGL